jgi:hypothetical protein
MGIGADEHAGHDAVAGERLDVASLRPLVTGATGDIGVHPRGQHLGRRALQRGEINRVPWQLAFEAAEIDIELVVAVLRHDSIPLS